MDFEDPLPHPQANTEGQRDVVFVKNVAFRADVGLDCWERKKDQPVLVSAEIFMNIRSAAKDDDFTKALDYRTLYKSIRGCDTFVYGCIFDLTRELVKSLIKSNPEQVRRGRLRILLPKALSRCEGGVFLDCGFEAENQPLVALQPMELSLRDIKLSCIVGINPAERVKKQPIVLQMRIVGKRNEKTNWSNLPSLFDRVVDVRAPCLRTGFRSNARLRK
jgi:FolB domain-containing protein